MTSILVAGGAGYVGARPYKQLTLAGFTPVVFDKLGAGHRDFACWAPLEVGDIRDADAVERAIWAYDAQAALHFAVHAYVCQSVVDSAGCYDNNVAGTLSLLAGMRAVRCTRLVFSSTCAVYGHPGARSITETTPPVRRTIYVQLAYATPTCAGQTSRPKSPRNAIRRRT